MHQMSSTQAKQSFGLLLEQVERGPVAIEKHSKIRAIVASPAYFREAGSRASVLQERKAARAQQALVDRDRLIKHQRIAIELLSSSAKEQRALVQQARTVVERWRTDGLCSLDYIEKWEALLGLPPRELALAMTTELDGWGPAMRQNSPWSGSTR